MNYELLKRWFQAEPDRCTVYTVNDRPSALVRVSGFWIDVDEDPEAIALALAEACKVSDLPVVDLETYLDKIGG